MYIEKRGQRNRVKVKRTDIRVKTVKKKRRRKSRERVTRKCRRRRRQEDIKKGQQKDERKGNGTESSRSPVGTPTPMVRLPGVPILLVTVDSL